MARSRYSQISPEHHVVRRCGFQVIERNAVTQQVIGLYPTAMSLKQENAERYLSTNWLEYFEGSKAQKLKAIVAVHRGKAKSSLSLKSGVATLRASRILEIGNAHNRKLKVIHTPNRPDPSYSRISGLPLDNSDGVLVANLADEAYEDFLLLKEVDELA